LSLYEFERRIGLGLQLVTEASFACTSPTDQTAPHNAHSIIETASAATELNKFNEITETDAADDCIAAKRPVRSGPASDAPADKLTAF